MTYEQFKNQYKNKVMMAAGGTLMLVIGWGIGKSASHSNSQPNYTTNSAAKPSNQATVPASVDVPANTNTVNPKPVSCLIKGTDSSKIYHLPGDLSYNRLKSPHCFATEAEAVAAGFRKAKK